MPLVPNFLKALNNNAALM